MELTECLSQLERLVRDALDARRGRRCFVYADHATRDGLLGLGVLVVTGGEVTATLSACLPLARRARKAPGEAARLAMTAVALGGVPVWARVGLGFEAATDLSALPHELAEPASGRRHLARRPRREVVRNAPTCRLLAERALRLGAWRGEVVTPRPEVTRAADPGDALPEGQGLHVYVDGSADERGHLGWACVWVQDGAIVRVEAGGRAGWSRDHGCDGATAAEREAVWLALSRLRDLRSRVGAFPAVLHSDRVDLQTMADGEPGVTMLLTPDCRHELMRMAHNTSRAARRDAARACTPKQPFVDAAD